MKKELIAYNKGYRVAHDGSVVYRGRVRVLGDNGRGYLRFNFRHEGKDVYCHAHRLQAYQKFGDAIYQDGILVRHLNGNSKDNRPENIAIGSQSDNMMDRPREERIRHALHTARMRKLNAMNRTA